MEIVRKKNGIQPLMLNKMIEIGINGNVLTEHTLRLFCVLFVEVANGNDLGIVGHEVFIVARSSEAAENS